MRPLRCQHSALPLSYTPTLEAANSGAVLLAQAVSLDRKPINCGSGFFAVMARHGLTGRWNKRALFPPSRRTLATKQRLLLLQDAMHILHICGPGPSGDCVNSDRDVGPHRACSMLVDYYSARSLKAARRLDWKRGGSWDARKPRPCCRCSASSPADRKAASVLIGPAPEKLGHGQKDFR